MTFPSHYQCTNAKLSATFFELKKSPLPQNQRDYIRIDYRVCLTVHLCPCYHSHLRCHPETTLQETSELIELPLISTWLNNFFYDHFLNKPNRFNDKKAILADYLKAKSNEYLLTRGDGLTISITDENYDRFYRVLCSKLQAKAWQIDRESDYNFVLRMEIILSADIVYDKVGTIGEALRLSRTDEEFERIRRENAIPVSAVDSLVFSSLDRVDEDDNGERLLCPICEEEFRVGDRVALTPCMHRFHLVCVSTWLLEHKGTCPLCRFSFGG